MTEEEAKTKWCPFNKDRDDTFYQRQNCIGSACMAWRVRPAHAENAGVSYCGLAGLP